VFQTIDIERLFSATASTCGMVNHKQDGGCRISSGPLRGARGWIDAEHVERSPPKTPSPVPAIRPRLSICN
jgi:hypothetical protein